MAALTFASLVLASTCLGLSAPEVGFEVEAVAPATLGGEGAFRTGGRLRVHWWLNNRPEARLGQQAFVVFTLPDTVRLEGDDILTVPPGARMPLDADFSADGLRVVVPLDLVLFPAGSIRGTFNVRALAVGPLSLSAACLVVDPRKDGHERTTVFTSRTAFTVRVADRIPILEVEDLTATPAADFVRESPDGQYEIHLLEDRFRVHDPRSGRRLFQAVGTMANFSPTSRYLIYEDPSAGFRIVDLSDLEYLPFEMPEGVTEVAWAHRDACGVGAPRGAPLSWCSRGSRNVGVLPWRASSSLVTGAVPGTRIQ